MVSQEDPSWNDNYLNSFYTVRIESPSTPPSPTCATAAKHRRTDKGLPETGAIKHSVILVTLSAAALLTTHTARMSLRF